MCLGNGSHQWSNLYTTRYILDPTPFHFASGHQHLVSAQAKLNSEANRPMR